MQLRLATRDDSSILSAIHTACFPRGWSHREFNSFFERDNVVAYIAEQDEHPIGFIFCWVIGSECELLSLAVMEGYRGKGYAKQLVVAAQEEVRKLGGRTMYLEVNVNNKVAQALYQDFDFVITGRRKDYYRQEDGTRSDAVTMTLRFEE